MDNTVTAAVFAIGSELLEGSITDTNSAWIGSRLVKHGINVEDVRLLPDNMDRMAELFLEAAEKYDLIITTGGLGPTFDDLTAEVVSRVAGKNYILNEEQLEHIKKTSRQVRHKPQGKPLSSGEAPRRLQNLL
ncbi:MAG: hypothetical protein LRY50_03745 [Geovibrio sp.]|nr:hypothetical protein [Geovibrio sp.]